MMHVITAACDSYSYVVQSKHSSTLLYPELPLKSQNKNSRVFQDLI